MKEKGNHEGCIEQMSRLFSDRLYSGKITVDEKERIRMDDWEMLPEIQMEVEKLWNIVGTDNIENISDIAGYRREFFNLFGFEYEGVNYNSDENEDVTIPSIDEVK